MTIDELKSKLPAELQPWADEYGPALITMGAEGVKAFIDRLIKGDIEGAYKAILEKMDNASLLDEWTTLNAAWQSENVRNAARLEVQRNALAVLLRILLAIALAGVGL